VCVLPLVTQDTANLINRRVVRRVGRGLGVVIWVRQVEGAAAESMKLRVAGMEGEVTADSRLPWKRLLKEILPNGMILTE